MVYIIVGRYWHTEGSQRYVFKTTFSTREEASAMVKMLQSACNPADEIQAEYWYELRPEGCI